MGHGAISAASRDRQVICPHQWFLAPDQCAEDFKQTPSHAEHGPHQQSLAREARRGKLAAGVDWFEVVDLPSSAFSVFAEPEMEGGV